MSFGFRELRRQFRALVGPAVIDRAYGLVTCLDWSGVQRLGRSLGLAGYRLERRRRRIALENVRRAFGGEMTEARQHEVVRESFVHLITLFLEAMKFSTVSLEEQLAVCPIEGEEHLQTALELGRGVVALGGHIGNWELGGIRAMVAGVPVLPLARLPSNPRLAAKFKELREREGYTMIDVSDQGLRTVLRALSDNLVVSILPDRYAKGHGLNVPFFGHKVHIWQTPALVARRMQTPVLPAYTLRQPDGTFRLRFQPPLEFVDTGDREGDLITNTAHTMAVLEEQIRLHPEQYMWTYELWRTELPTPKMV